jgi:hypothetical protein
VAPENSALKPLLSGNNGGRQGAADRRSAKKVPTIERAEKKAHAVEAAVRAAREVRKDEIEVGRTATPSPAIRNVRTKGNAHRAHAQIAMTSVDTAGRQDV